MRNINYFKNDIINRSISLENYTKSAKGVYFLLQDDEIVYVGSSTNVNSRLATHIGEKRKQFNKIFFFKTANYIQLEKEYIKKFNPKYNIIHNPNACEYVEDIIPPEILKIPEIPEIENTIPIEISDKKTCPSFNMYLKRNNLMYINLLNVNYIFDRLNEVTIKNVTINTSGLIGNIDISLFPKR